eukprot:SAG31_NODE_936_length_10870_cov_5.136966_11_plen_99_part_00
MHIIIKNLTEYHRSLGLHIDMYHLDSGFWHSAHKDGHCDGVTASNWSASEFHWPHTAGPDGRIGDGLSSKCGVCATIDIEHWKLAKTVYFFQGVGLSG